MSIKGELTNIVNILDILSCTTKVTCLGRVFSYSFKPSLFLLAHQVGESVFTVFPISQGEYSGFQVTGLIKWGQKSNAPQKSIGLPTKPNKIPWPKISPKNVPCQISKPRIMFFVFVSFRHKFLAEFLEVGGVLTVLEILGLKQAKEVTILSSLMYIMFKHGSRNSSDCF